MKPEDFKNIVLEFIDEFAAEIKIQVSRESIEELSELLISSEAINFTQRMNKIYKDNEILDEHGNILIIQHPVNLESRINWIESNVGTLDLTEEEDRWFRADASYGQNIIERLGFKYVNE